MDGYRNGRHTEGEALREGFSRKTFVRLGALLGVGAAAGSVLAACGGLPGARPGGGARGGESGDGEPAAGSRAIARASEARPGAVVEFEDPNGYPAVLVRLRGGDLVAYSAVCSHEGCTVAYKNGRLVCPCHGSIFDPTNNARVVRGPASLPLAKVRIAVEHGTVFRR